MEKMRDFVRKHKVISYISGFGVIVFFNCFGFPIYNLNKDWPFMPTITKIYIVLAAAWITGGILYGLFLKKKRSFYSIYDNPAFFVRIRLSILFRIR